MGTKPTSPLSFFSFPRPLSVAAFRRLFWGRFPPPSSFSLPTISASLPRLSFSSSLSLLFSFSTSLSLSSIQTAFARSPTFGHLTTTLIGPLESEDTDEQFPMRGRAVNVRGRATRSRLRVCNDSGASTCLAEPRVQGVVSLSPATSTAISRCQSIPLSLLITMLLSIHDKSAWIIDMPFSFKNGKFCQLIRVKQSLILR